MLVIMQKKANLDTSNIDLQIFIVAGIFTKKRWRISIRRVSQVKEIRTRTKFDRR